MNLFGPGIPVFLVDPSVIGALPTQIKFFDVYYTESPLVGIQVMGDPSPEAPVSLCVTIDPFVGTDCPDWDETVVGFYANDR